MTFDEIVTEIMDQLNLTSADAQERIGRAVNILYRTVTSSIGIEVARRITGVTAQTTPGQQTLTFTGIEKIERLIDDHNGTIVEIEEFTLEDVRSKNPNAGDTIKMWAVEKMGPSTITVLFDTLPQTAFTLKADGLQTAATLSGAQVPNFNQDYHDILVEGVLAKELRKAEKTTLAEIAKETYDSRLSELRFFIAKTHATIRQGGANAKSSLMGPGGGGGSAPSGGTSYTQTGQLTFDRGAATAPFVVAQPNAAKVINLDADKLDGLDSIDLEAAAVAQAADNASVLIALQVFS